MAFTKATLTGSKDTIKAAWTKFNDLIDDLLSVANGLGASQIGIEDTAGNMAAANVEDGLAEIYTDTTGARVIANGFEEDGVTTTGLTWGYQAGNIRDGNTVTTVVAGTIALTDDTINYVQINEAGVVSKNVTGFTADKIPLRQITTASGVQTVSTDMRCWLSTSYPALLRARGLPRAQFVWCESLDYDGGTVIFVEGETVTGAGGATGVVEHIVGDATSGVLYLTTRNATAYINDEAITGDGTGAAVANQASAKNAIVLHPAAYHHSGTVEQIVYWNSKIAHEVDNSGGTDIYYLYLDDSAIVTASSPIITNTQLISSNTEPTENFTKIGWYNGEDRCIFAAYSESTSLAEFDHNGSELQLRSSVSALGVTDVDTTWTDVDCSAVVPVFCRNVSFAGSVEVKTTDAHVNFSVKNKKSIATNAKVWCGLERIGTDQSIIGCTTQIGVDTSQTFQVKCSRSDADTVSISIVGWWFPLNV